jgi:hypothetical protein
MKNGRLVGDFAEVCGVMSPTSYRAAPPRTEWRRENLHHSAITCKGTGNQAAHSAHRKHSAWDQIGTKTLLAEGPGLARLIISISIRSQAARKDVHRNLCGQGESQIGARKGKCQGRDQQPVSSPALGSFFSSERTPRAGSAYDALPRGQATSGALNFGQAAESCLVSNTPRVTPGQSRQDGRKSEQSRPSAGMGAERLPRKALGRIETARAMTRHLSISNRNGGGL